MTKTADYLKKALIKPHRRPYTVAIVSYALALLRKPVRYNPTVQLMRAAAPGTPTLAQADILSLGNK